MANIEPKGSYIETFPAGTDVATILAQANTREPRTIVNADAEVHVRNRILTAMRMALALAAQKNVRADDPLLQAGLRGVAEGAAVEIIHTLDLEPSYVNLPQIDSQ